MAKVKTFYFCQNCGYQSSKWLGKCTSCNEWNTMVEEVVHKEEKKEWKSESSSRTTSNKPHRIGEIEYEKLARIGSCDGEFDRVLGGGVVPGSLVLIGGEPGIGKSTLMLQVALAIRDYKVLYVSGEESKTQIKMRADRLPFQSENCFILSETNTQNIFKQIEALEPDLLVIDSIQTLNSTHIDSAAGSISQVRECTSELLKYAKETGVPVFLIGHITKEGTLAGPKVLEHMVDTVLQFEGDRNMTYRILRTIKNRFGSTSELGIYEMTGAGMRQVTNPSEILLSQRDEALAGVSIAATLEGNRPLLVEVQSLVGTATFGTPQRTSTGYDVKKLSMLLAVLEKRCGFRLSTQDVFLNIAGGIKVDDPSIDLAICVAVISSYNEMSVPATFCFAAEVGLGGEVRAINQVEKRISEAEKLGFDEIFISKYNKLSVDIASFKIKVNMVTKIDQIISYLFG